MPGKTNKSNNPPPPAAGAASEEPPVVPLQRRCGTMAVHYRHLHSDPDYLRARAASETHYSAIVQGRRALARVGVTTIPVVVHVLFNTAQQNLSNAQIQSQIDVMNHDYRKTNPDVASAPAAFAPLAADARIQFTLATVDPNGAATTGITRTQTNSASFSDNDAMKSSAMGGHDAWPRDKYLNIWTVPRLTSPQGDLLGYAQFPGGNAATDGVVILHSAFGTNGTAAAPFNLGRTATHEVGHWLNLHHIWGDDNNACTGSDLVADTPNQAGPNFGKPAFPHVTCNNGPNGDMFMNYMDYVDDAAMFLFTTGQVARLQASLDSDRPTLGSSTSATSPILDTPVVTLKFGDDAPVTLKFRDDVPPPSLKFRDDGPPPSLKFRDDSPPSLKFRDDSPPSLKFRDDIPKLKITDDGIPQGPGGFGPGPGPLGAAFAGSGRTSAAPFVLSTPHHSMAWVQMFPQAAAEAVNSAEDQLRQYEEVLEQYGQADSAGQLSSAERQAAESIYADYASLVAEYRQLTGS